MLAVDARRFVCAMQELTDGHVWATEQVWREVWGACVANSHRAAKRSVQSLLRRQALAEGIDSRQLIVVRSAANVAAMRQWLEEERDRNDRAWEYVPSPDERELALRHAGSNAERTRASEARRLAAIREHLADASG